MTTGAGAPPPGRPQFEFRPRPSDEPAARPRVVSTAAALWLLCGGLALVAALLMLLDLDAVQAAVDAVVRRDFPAENPAVGERAAAWTLVVLVGGAAVVGTAIAGTALLLRGGRGGARFVLVLLLVGLGLLVLLTVDAVPPVVRLALLLAGSCGVVATALTALPVTARWFAARG